jgi:tRNA (mo5U34)-methyltransferase
VDKQPVRERIEQLGPWFHNMTLAGVQTAPGHFLCDYPARHWRTFESALPSDLRGCTVLDVGCNAGFFSIALKRRGADRVVAIDPDPRYLEQARLAAEVSGVDLELQQLNVYDVARLRERFDIVLFLGVLYHLRHPLLALDLLHDHVVGDRLLVQTMIRGALEAEPLEDDYAFEETAVFERRSYPKMHFVEAKYCGDVTNWWIPNRPCVEAMLRSAGFQIVTSPAPEVFLCRRAELTPVEVEGRRFA